MVNPGALEVDTGLKVSLAPFHNPAARLVRGIKEEAMRKILVLALATMLFGAACQQSEETAPPAAPEASAAAPAEASPAAAEASPAAPEASPAAPAPASSPASP